MNFESIHDRKAELSLEVRYLMAMSLTEAGPLQSDI